MCEHVLRKTAENVCITFTAGQNALLVTTAEGTVLAEGQMPDCGPNHSEMKARTRISWFYKEKQDCAFPVLFSTRPKQQPHRRMRAQV